MDYPITKVFYIAASIVFTLAIFTGVILAIREIRNIYGYTSEVSNSISEKFESVVSQYSLAELNGVQLINTIKKFEDDPTVTVDYSGRQELKEWIKDDKKYINSEQVTVRDEIEYIANGVTVTREKAPAITFGYLDKYDVTVRSEYENITIVFTKKI